MDIIVLDEIEFKIDRDALFGRAGGSSDIELVERVLQQASKKARPKAMYRPAFVEERGDDFIKIDGVRFQSRVLSVNLSEVERVFPFVVTSGTELEEWTDSIADREERFFADRAKELAFLGALKACFEHMDQNFSPGSCSVMNPGSLPDWPISEQKSLFELLGNSGEAIGVRMLSSFMMYPSRTSSGIRFPSQVKFESCMLCPRDNCPLRKAPYDPDLFQKKYAPE